MRGVRARPAAIPDGMVASSFVAGARRDATRTSGFSCSKAVVDGVPASAQGRAEGLADQYTIYTY